MTQQLWRFKRGKTSSRSRLVFLLPTFLFILLSLIYAQPSSAMTRVYKAILEGKTYYIVELHPIRVETMILGRTVLPDNDARNLVLGGRLEDGSTQEEDYSALEFLTYEGSPLTSSPDFHPLSEELKHRLVGSAVKHEVAHVLEDYLFDSIESWALGQYLKRHRIESAELLAEIREELKSYSQGLGWIAVLDARKKILGTLAYAIRTTEAPKFPEESRLGIEIPEGDLIETDAYPVYRKGKIQNLQYPVRTGLTLALKRYIIDRESPIDLLQVLIAFGERSGMSRGMVETKFPKIHRGQVVKDGEFLHLVDKYVLESDAIAARVYQRPPYNFTLYWQRGSDYVLQANRQQFLSLLEDNPRIHAAGKVSGKTFLSMAQIMGGVVVSPEQQDGHYFKGSYPSKTMHQFKLDWLPTTKTCHSLFFTESRSFR